MPTGVAGVHGGRHARLFPTFEDVTEPAGLATDVPVPECGQFANGAAWADVDGDGWQDLVVTRLGDPVATFVNEGDGTFSERAAVAAGDRSRHQWRGIRRLRQRRRSRLALVGDGRDMLLPNDGNGRFEDVTAAAGTSVATRVAG